MQGNQLSDNSNTTAGIVNERKKTKFVKRSEHGDHLNRIEMKKNEPINMIIENKGCQTVFSVNEPMTKAQNLLHRKQTNLGPLRKLCYFMIGLFRS